MRFIIFSFFTILCLTACNTDSSGGRVDSDNIDSNTEMSYEDVEQLAEDFYDNRKDENFNAALDFIHPIALDKVGQEKWIESISEAHKFGELEQATLSRKEETKDAVLLYYEVQFTKRKVYERLKFQAIRSGGWGIAGFSGRKEDANYDD